MHAIYRATYRLVSILWIAPALAANPASPLMTDPHVTHTAPAATRAPSPQVAAAQTLYFANRAQLAQSQLALRDAQNRAAIAARTTLSAANPGRISPMTSLASAKDKLTSTSVAGWPSGIWLVNGQAQNFTVTPGGYITIFGKDFGYDMGTVRLYGQTSLLEFQVIGWTDQQIFALLPADVRGFPDQVMTIQVVTNAGRPYLLDGANFYAAREEQAIASGLDRMIAFHGSNNGPMTWYTSMTPDGKVVRHFTQIADAYAVCPPPGMDTLVFNPLPSGFVLSGISARFGRTDSGSLNSYGSPGYRKFTPGYALGNWGTTTMAVDRSRSVTVDMIPVSWGVWFDHATPSDWSFHSPDQCDSEYQVAVWVIGPAGVPFTAG